MSYSNVDDTLEGYKIKSALPFKIFSTINFGFTSLFYRITKLAEIIYSETVDVELKKMQLHKVIEFIVQSCPT